MRVREDGQQNMARSSRPTSQTCRKMRRLMRNRRATARIKTVAIHLGKRSTPSVAIDTFNGLVQRRNILRLQYIRERILGRDHGLKQMLHTDISRSTPGANGHRFIQQRAHLRRHPHLHDLLPLNNTRSPRKFRLK